MSSSLIFTCCRGERFLRLPLYGLTHIPAFTVDDWIFSIMLPAYTLGIVVLGFVIRWALQIILLRHVDGGGGEQKQEPTNASNTTSTTRSTRLLYSVQLPLISLVLAYTLIGGVLLPGPMGRWIAQMVQPAAKNHRIRYEQMAKQLQVWERESKLLLGKPQEQHSHSFAAPLANITPNALPAANITFWSEQRATEIADHVIHLKDTHWTYAAPLGRGSGLFLLGRKYGGAKHNGEFLLPEQEEALGKALWKDEFFSQVMDEFQQGTERMLGNVPCRLYKESWPPTFIMHTGSVISTHFEVMDIHTDKILPTWFQRNVQREARVHQRQWSHQLSLLVALKLPAVGGGAFDYYDSNGNKTTIQHKVGKAILAECQRPHNLHEFHQADVDSGDIRMVLHAFLVPCKTIQDNSPQWQIIGPLGFGSPTWETLTEPLN